MGAVPELLDVERWRFAECLRLGVPVDNAEAFAIGDGDLEQLRQLIADGCPPVLAVQIA